MSINTNQSEKRFFTNSQISIFIIKYNILLTNMIVISSQNVMFRYPAIILLLLFKI